MGGGTATRGNREEKRRCEGAGEAKDEKLLGLVSVSEIKGGRLTIGKRSI